MGKRISSSILALILVLLPAVTVFAAPGPLDPTPLAEWFGARVTQQFGYYHHGVDFGTGWNPIPATWHGQVTYAGPGGGYGNLVIVQDGDWQMLYAHLSAIYVRAGQQIEPGMVVGLSGNTGASDGAHLHYEVRFRGTPVDPMTAPAASIARPRGDFIELHIRPARPGAIPSWADLWTVVQWQSPNGDWLDVEGWQGGVDEVDGDQGVKRWWVSADDLGRESFRWIVYSSPGGRELARSGTFRLPDGEWAVVVGAWVR